MNHINGEMLGVAEINRRNLPKVKRPIQTMTLDGQTMTIKDWAKEVGMSEGSLRSRRLWGWDDRRILTTPRQDVYSSKRTTPTRYEIELWLDDNPGSCLQCLHPAPPGVTRYGRWVRYHLPGVFHTYYLSRVSAGTKPKEEQ